MLIFDISISWISLSYNEISEWDWRKGENDFLFFERLFTNFFVRIVIADLCTRYKTEGIYVLDNFFFIQHNCVMTDFTVFFNYIDEN